MPQYKYKAARRLIKHNYKIKKSLLSLYEDEDFIITELRKSFLKDNKDEMRAKVTHNLKILYEALNNPFRYKV